MPDLSKLCRACLIAIDTFKYNLFDNVSPEVYWFCTTIEVMEDQNLPKSLCSICYDLLTKFSEFKKTCLQSEQTLIKYSTDTSDTERQEWKITENSKINIQKDILNKFNDKYEVGIIVKEEDFEDHYGNDFNADDLVSEIKVTVKKNKALKKVRVKTSKGRKKLTCELCSKSFVSHERFEVHKLTHQTKVKTLKCAPCNKTFITWSGLRRHHASWHMRVSLSSVRCRTCGKIARSRETLRTHEKLHTERNLFICNVCGKSCSTSSVLKAHLETHKENRERQYTCEHCGKKFYTNKILGSHVQRCHTGKRYICHICSYPFTDKYNLAKHLLNHDGKRRDFKCEICNKAYTSRTSYVEHQRTHSGERPYICNYCSKCFISKRRLTEHNRTHTGEKPHKCSVCDHSFAQRGTLTRHMKVHDRVVPILN